MVYPLSHKEIFHLKNEFYIIFPLNLKLDEMFLFFRKWRGKGTDYTQYTNI